MKTLYDARATYRRQKDYENYLFIKELEPVWLFWTWQSIVFDSLDIGMFYVIPSCPPGRAGVLARHY